MLDWCVGYACDATKSLKTIRCMMNSLIVLYCRKNTWEKIRHKQPGPESPDEPEETRAFCVKWARWTSRRWRRSARRTTSTPSWRVSTTCRTSYRSSLRNFKSWRCRLMVRIFIIINKIHYNLCYCCMPPKPDFCLLFWRRPRSISMACRKIVIKTRMYHRLST